MFGQNTDFENLINQIYTDIVPKDFEYYNLVDSSFITKFDQYSLEPDELTVIKTKYRDFPYEKFIQKSKIFEIINWKNYHLKNAKIYSIDSIPKFESQIKSTILVPYKINQEELDSLNKVKKYYEVIVPIKKSWGRKKIDKEIEKTWDERSKNVKAENKIYFRFSTPLIINDYAIITLNQSGRGASYLYKYIDGFWTQIFIFKRWVS